MFNVPLIAICHVPRVFLFLSCLFSKL